MLWPNVDRWGGIKAIDMKKVLNHNQNFFKLLTTLALLTAYIGWIRLYIFSLSLNIIITEKCIYIWITLHLQSLPSLLANYNFMTQKINKKLICIFPLLCRSKEAGVIQLLCWLMQFKRVILLPLYRQKFTIYTLADELLQYNGKKFIYFQEHSRK